MSEPLEGANEDCVGPSSEGAGKADGCKGCPNQKACSSGKFQTENPEQRERDEKVASVLSNISRVVLVLSGKGGVGKSTCSTQLAFSLCKKGFKVGLLDVDICGPSVPLMLGLRGHEVHQSSSGWSPVYLPLDEYDGELAVMSVGFLVSNQDSAIIWRGPKKNGLIEQFFTSVDWGELDFLIIDTPPGTSDEHISLVQLLKKHLRHHDGAVVVSTPQEAAMADVRKELNFCNTTKLNVLGLVENMSKSVVNFEDITFLSEGKEVPSTQVVDHIKSAFPNLKLSIDLFPKANGGVSAMASSFGVPFLGSIPLDRSVQVASDSGREMLDGVALDAWDQIVEKILAIVNFSQVSTQEDVEASGSGIIGS